MTEAARRGPLLVVLAVLTALAPFSIDVYAPSLPRIHDDLGGEAWQTQASVTACLLGIGLGQLLWGPLSDRIGRRRVIAVGAIGWTLASVLSALVATPSELIAARAAAGLCGAACIVVARSVVRDISTTPGQIAGRIALLATVSAAAPIVAPTIGAGIAAVGGWRADFVALTVLGALASVAVVVLVPETLVARTSAPVLAALAGALRDRELRGIAAVLAAQSLGFYAYVATASFVVEQEHGYGPGVFALVFGTNALAMLGANLVFRRLVRRRHSSALLGIGLAVAGVGGALIAITAAAHGPDPVLWSASTLFAAAVGFVLPASHGWGQLTAPPSGAASALTGAAQFLGGVLGSPLTGLLGPTALVLGLIVAASSVLALVFWRFARQARRVAVIDPDAST